MKVFWNLIEYGTLNWRIRIALCWYFFSNFSISLCCSDSVLLQYFQDDLLFRYIICTNLERIWSSDLQIHYIKVTITPCLINPVKNNKIRSWKKFRSTKQISSRPWVKSWPWPIPGKSFQLRKISSNLKKSRQTRPEKIRKIPDPPAKI